MKGLSSKSENFPSAGKQPPPVSPGQRRFICTSCNANVCRLSTSRTDKNPGRQYYACRSCDRFCKWTDQVRDDELIDVPNCGGCSAGVCRVRREKTGPNSGRILFMCRVKEGEGSCGYRVWQDELKMPVGERPDERLTSSQLTTTNWVDIGSTNTDDIVTSLKSTMTNWDDIGSTRTDEIATSIKSTPTNWDDIGSANTDDVVTSLKSTTTNCDETGPTNAVVVEETRPGDDNDSPVIDASRQRECLGVTRGKMEQPKSQEERCDESSRRPSKRSRYGDLKAPGSLVSANSSTLHLPTNSMSIHHGWVMAAFERNLGTQLQAWWGRLAFHPIPCLTTRASASFAFNVSSTFWVKEKIAVNSCNPTTLTTTLPEGESYVKPPFNPADTAGPSGTKPLHSSLDLPLPSEPFHGTGTHNVMSKSILEAFSQAAEHIQNDLLTRLETMDSKDHEAMRQEAESTFAALDHLLFDYQDFKQRVEELIHRARSLAEIEQSMPMNDSYQQLVDHCSSERTSLDKFNFLHAKAVDDVTNNKKHLRELQEKVRSARDWIIQIEAELSSFEVEMRTMEQQLEQISKIKEVLEGQYLIVSRELEESQKFYERKEAELSAARAAFEKAKALLRG